MPRERHIGEVLVKELGIPGEYGSSDHCILPLALIAPSHVQGLQFAQFMSHNQRVLGRNMPRLEPPMHYITMTCASEISAVPTATLSNQARLGRLQSVKLGQTLVTTILYRRPPSISIAGTYRTHEQS